MMQLGSSNFISDMFSPAPALAPGPIQVANPQLDPVVAQQARFRIDGTGPVAARSITAVTAPAAQLLATDPRAEQAVRRVLDLVQDAAGGGPASASLAFHGVSFADSDLGLAANTYQAHLDNDEPYRAAFQRLSAPGRAKDVIRLGAASKEKTQGVLANVLSGWMNLGPVASGALLGRAGTAGQQDLADAVRIVAHESVHAADRSATGLSDDADAGFSEAVADARTTTLPKLQRARTILGLDGSVSDAALAASLRIRPYRELENRLDNTMATFGVTRDSAEGERILRLPLKQSIDALATGLAQALDGTVETARRALDISFAEAWKLQKA